MSDATTLKAPRVTDSSLRDGSHPMRHQFTREQVRAIAQALDEAGRFFDPVRLLCNVGDGFDLRGAQCVSPGKNSRASAARDRHRP